MKSRDERLVGGLIIAIFMGLLYYAVTLNIQYIPISPIIDAWIPVGYWVLLIGSIATWLIAQMRKMSQGWNYFALLTVLCTVFFGLEYVEHFARFADPYGLMWLAQFVNGGAPSSYSGTPYLQNWPGWFILMDAFKLVTGMGNLAILKFMLFWIQISALALSIAIGRAAFGGTTGATLFPAITIFLMPWTFIGAAPFAFGALYFLLAFFSLLDSQKGGNRFAIFVLAFIAAILTHGLTALEIVILVLGIFSIGQMISHSKRTMLQGSPSQPTPYLSVRFVLVPVSIVIFSAWALFSSFLRQQFAAFISLLSGLGTSPLTYQFGYLTQYRLGSVIAAAMYVIVFSAFVVFGLLVNRRRITIRYLQPIILAGVLSIALYFFPFVSQDLSDRIFQAVFPLLALFLSNSIVQIAHSKNLMRIAVLFIALLLALGFVFYYSHEYVMVYSSTDLAGDRYEAAFAPTNLSLGWFSLAPQPFEMASSPNLPMTVYPIEYTTPSVSSLFTESDIIVNSTMTSNSLLYYYGNNSLHTFLTNSYLNEVYDSDFYSVYVKLNA